MADPTKQVPKYQPPAQTPQKDDQTSIVDSGTQTSPPSEAPQSASVSAQASQQSFDEPAAEQSEWQAAQQEQFVEDQQPPAPSVESVSWTSAEYIEHEKPPMWYGIFLGSTIAVSGIIYILTKEVLATIAILVVGGSAAFFASRPPASRNYEITGEYIKVDSKKYNIEDFKSFSIVEEGAKDSIWLQPTRRFAPFLIIYFNAEDEQRIIATLSTLLPHEERELDNLDRLTKKLRF